MQLHGLSLVLVELNHSQDTVDLGLVIPVRHLHDHWLVPTFLEAISIRRVIYQAYSGLTMEHEADGHAVRYVERVPPR